MGWNPWNVFMNKATEGLIRQQVDLLQHYGLDKLGYVYINLDDGWLLKDRDSEGKIQINYERFPSGMKDMGEYLHAKNLKFGNIFLVIILGLYNSAGPNTCHGGAGGLIHEKVDAQSYSDWEVDFLKYDSCGGLGMERYVAMSRALN